MEDKKFDAVKIAREIRDEQERQLAGKSNEARLAYYQQKAAEMRARVPALAAGRIERADKPQ